jgi:hypothetical protein
MNPLKKFSPDMVANCHLVFLYFQACRKILPYSNPRHILETMRIRPGRSAEFVLRTEAYVLNVRNTCESCLARLKFGDTVTKPTRTPRWTARQHRSKTLSVRKRTS